ncbi:MAG: SulP family inorganic anion transporter [Bradymonadaceae bacterium]
MDEQRTSETLWRRCRGDLVAGLTTAVLLIPQSMAYAALAGLPPIVGLYASLVPLLAYAALGSSRQLTVGPVAIVSLMTAHVLAGHAHLGPERLIMLAALLAAMVGLIQLLMAAMRPAVLVRLIAPPVLMGFVSAMAILTMSTQLDDLLGLEIAGTTRPHEVLLGVVAALPQTHVWTALIAGVALVILVGLSKLRPAFPSALVVVILGSLAAWALGGESRGIATVGELASGLPSIVFFWPDAADVGALFMGAVAIAFVSFLQSIASATIFANRHGYTLSPVRELLGLAGANLVGSLFQAFPVAGSFSRTAVNDAAGARTRWAAVVTALSVALTLLFITSFFFYLPLSILAAIIAVAVARLINISGWLGYFRRDPGALVVALITFAVTLVVGVEIGITVGVAASLIRQRATRHASETDPAPVCLS